MQADLESSARNAAAKAARRQIGAVVGVLQADRHAVACAGSVSVPDGPRPNGLTLMDIGSVTKTFTSLELARQVDSGTVRLSTEARDLLPELADTPITLEQLATHTSGLPRSPIGTWGELRDDDPYRALDETAVLDAVRQAKPTDKRRVSYSNLGASVLGLALQRLTGAQSYDALMAEITHDLGLADTRAHLTEDQRARLATGYRWRDRPTSEWDLEGMAACGALRSTALDMITYLRAQVSGATTAIRSTQQLRAQQGRFGVGLGWLIMDLDVGRMYFHNGATGGFRCFIGFIPRRASGVVILTNKYTLRGPDKVAVDLLRSISAGQEVHAGPA